MKKTTRILWMALAMLMLSVSCTKKSSEKQILSFRFMSPSVEAVIDEDLKKVEATMPWETGVTTLVPIITISEKATISPASGVLTDFTDPVTYTVTAEDGSQTDYTVTVTIEAQPFVGIWGVEKIEYYNIDYAGNPIASSMSTFVLVPGDQQSGIDMIFRENNTGEMRDRSQDTLKLDWNEETHAYETIIICPDTTLVTGFTYSYDAQDATLYMNMEYAHAFRMNIVDLERDSFVYENEYAPSYVEKAYLKRLSYTPDKSTGRKNQNRPSKKGSLLGKK